MKKDLHKQVFFLGTPQGIRTPDLLVRSQLLYPAELAAHIHNALYIITNYRKSQAEKRKIINKKSAKLPFVQNVKKILILRSIIDKCIKLVYNKVTIKNLEKM